MPNFAKSWQDAASFMIALVFTLAMLTVIGIAIYYLCQFLYWAGLLSFAVLVVMLTIGVVSYLLYQIERQLRLLIGSIISGWNEVRNRRKN